ncbi:adenosine deaminase [Tessaracoccus sp. ZS01]|uniref:adenosine deaminase n=1 Tax=Tessaracoccus sp. ZS01 TaxID=1906324 RepID=UPI00096FBE03|nr:adenosine deaminase [Tessaracoccus sp. ZS01]MCG6568715.1 adenosine deaminase [Tessaracoccus sp. ZS01]OMG51916.1 adenosine deaminase [Tessaracoccus sp. ZS01]
MLSLDDLRALPKVALHDHLDGGLRPETVIEHCAANGHELPTTDPEGLRRWFFEAADSGSLVRYLETFAHTVAAMQTAEQLERVAHEFVVDQAEDGVVYAEARWAPAQHLGRGLTLQQSVEAVRDGLASGMRAAAASGHAIVARQILTSLRQDDPTVEIAQLAIDNRDDSVCGFDIAGAEDGFPPSRFEGAFRLLKKHNMFFTIHAGEAFGPPSIWEAVQLCGGNRLGHGVRIVEDLTIEEDRVRFGRLAAYVRDAQIPLEVAPSSNLQTGIAGQMKDHPIDLLKGLQFNVTVNCDNRLMSDTTMSREYLKLVKTFRWDLDDVERTIVGAMRAAFLPHDQRESMIREVILPAFAAAR